MNKIIQTQLNKCNVANVSNYDKETNTIFIPKHTLIDVKIDNCYLISLEDELLNPSENDTLFCNWNNGKHPKYKYLKIDVSKKLGRMIFVNSIAYDFENKKDLNEMWSGWLPLEKINIINKI